jgi:TRAP transporter TAXI family solute receptor
MKKFFMVPFLILTIFTLAACGMGGSSTLGPSDSEKQSEETSEQNSIKEPVNITWAAGSMGGGWYSMASGMSSILKEKNSNINIKVIPGGSLQNIPFLDNSSAQIAWEQPPFVLAALEGKEPFEQASPNLRAIGNGFSQNYFHFAVPADSDIENSDDIFKNDNPPKIALTPVNNADEWVFSKILDYYGTSYDKLKDAGGAFFHGSYTEQAEQFKNENVDVIFAQLSLPGSAITDAAVSRDLKLIPMSDGLIEHLSESALGKGTIPAGTYPNVTNGDKDIQTATMATVLVTNKDVPDDLVYEITKIINENTDRLPAIHASLKDYKIEDAYKDLGSELHPGAEKYYKEKGIIK